MVQVNTDNSALYYLQKNQKPSPGLGNVAAYALSRVTCKDVDLSALESKVTIEIKSGETVNSDFFTNLVKWNQLAGNDPTNSYVVYGGKQKQTRAQGTAFGWTQLSSLPIV